MASIFWCCCSKKGSVDLIEQKTKANKEESTNVYAVQKPDNGTAAGVPNASQCEQRLPLLSSDAMEDSIEDLGDFSAVQRETEILRPYRKPPPPKRARQTRAPRVVKSGTNDIFTELYDEDANYGSDKENEDVDSVQLRQDDERSKRDTRSSMLTDIEQTLAALHMSEQYTTPPSVELQPKEIFKANTPTQKDTLAIAKTQLESDWRNSTGNSVDKRSSFQLSAEIKPETAATVENTSPKTSPVANPRIGPKVSPKPSPKVRSKLRIHDNPATASTTLENSSEILDDASFTSSLEVKLNREVNTAPQDLEKETPLIDLTLADTTTGNAIAAPELEVRTNNESNAGLKRPESPPGVARENLEPTEEQKHEDNINCFSGSCITTASSQAAKTAEGVAADRPADENTIKEFSGNLEKREESSHLDNQTLDKSISVEKEDLPLDYHKFDKSISIEKEDLPLDNHKLDKSISVEKEDLPLGNHKLDKSISMEKEDLPFGNHKLDKSISMEKEDLPFGNHKLDKSISVEKEVSPLDNHKLDKSISVEKEDLPFGNHKLDKSISVEKEVSPLDNHKFDKSISVEKEDLPFGNHKFDESISVEKEDLPFGNHKFDKSISVEKEVSPLDNHKLDKSISVEKEDLPFGNHKFDKSLSVEKEDLPLGNKKLDKSISVEKEDLPLCNYKLDKSISVEKEDLPRLKLNQRASVEKEEAVKSAGQTGISNGKGTEHSVNEQVKQNGTDKSSKTGVKDAARHAEAAQQPSPDRETQPGCNEDRSRSQETGKQQRESTEDQAGKGKISKIPVRAGSKPRTSPPKLTSNEKASSPPI